MADKHVERLQRIADQWRADASQWGDPDGEIAADIAAIEAGIAALQAPAQACSAFAFASPDGPVVACAKTLGHLGNHASVDGDTEWKG